ncbi:hypothetical protein ANN_20972 [Periplaneta americana]|uniref:Uncharacterized protein n=1 Tax=Periplaneta americana TaxID=6978 RepID=A0ABQ8SEI5_PERAM|nr:hypothetical protein ANN_20972 [Periplaneta americana]
MAVSYQLYKAENITKNTSIVSPAFLSDSETSKETTVVQMSHSFSNALCSACLWSAAKTNLQRLQVLQNKVGRIISGADYDIRIVQLHEDLGLKYITQEIQQTASTFYLQTSKNFNPIISKLGHYDPRNFKATEVNMSDDSCSGHEYKSTKEISDISEVLDEQEPEKMEVNFIIPDTCRNDTSTNRNSFSPDKTSLLSGLTKTATNLLDKDYFWDCEDNQTKQDESINIHNTETEDQVASQRASERNRTHEARHCGTSVDSVDSRTGVDIDKQGIEYVCEDCQETEFVVITEVEDFRSEAECARITAEIEKLEYIYKDNKQARKSCSIMSVISSNMEKNGKCEVHSVESNTKIQTAKSQWQEELVEDQRTSETSFDPQNANFVPDDIQSQYWNIIEENEAMLAIKHGVSQSLGKKQEESSIKSQKENVIIDVKDTECFKNKCVVKTCEFYLPKTVETHINEQSKVELEAVENKTSNKSIQEKDKVSNLKMDDSKPVTTAGNQESLYDYKGNMQKDLDEKYTLQTSSHLNGTLRTEHKIDNSLLQQAEKATNIKEEYVKHMLNESLDYEIKGMSNSPHVENYSQVRMDGEHKMKEDDIQKALIDANKLVNSKQEDGSEIQTDNDKNYFTNIKIESICNGGKGFQLIDFNRKLTSEVQFSKNITEDGLSKGENPADNVEHKESIYVNTRPTTSQAIVTTKEENEKLTLQTQCSNTVEIEVDNDFSVIQTEKTPNYTVSEDKIIEQEEEMELPLVNIEDSAISIYNEDSVQDHNYTSCEVQRTFAIPATEISIQRECYPQTIMFSMPPYRPPIISTDFRELQQTYVGNFGSQSETHSAVSADSFEPFLLKSIGNEIKHMEGIPTDNNVDNEIYTYTVKISSGHHSLLTKFLQNVSVDSDQKRMMKLEGPDKSLHSTMAEAIDREESDPSDFPLLQLTQHPMEDVSRNSTTICESLVGEEVAHAIFSVLNQQIASSKTNVSPHNISSELMKPEPKSSKPKLLITEVAENILEEPVKSSETEAMNENRKNIGQKETNDVACLTNISAELLLNEKQENKHHPMPSEIVDKISLNIPYVNSPFHVKSLSGDLKIEISKIHLCSSIFNCLENDSEVTPEACNQEPELKENTAFQTANEIVDDTMKQVNVLEDDDFENPVVDYINSTAEYSTENLRIALIVAQNIEPNILKIINNLTCSQKSLQESNGIKENASELMESSIEVLCNTSQSQEVTVTENYDDFNPNKSVEISCGVMKPQNILITEDSEVINFVSLKSQNFESNLEDTEYKEKTKSVHLENKTEILRRNVDDTIDRINNAVNIQDIEDYVTFDTSETTISEVLSTSQRELQQLGLSTNINHLYKNEERETNTEITKGSSEIGIMNLENVVVSDIHENHGLIVEGLLENPVSTGNIEEALEAMENSVKVDGEPEHPSTMVATSLNNNPRQNNSDISDVLSQDKYESDSQGTESQPEELKKIDEILKNQALKVSYQYLDLESHSEELAEQEEAEILCEMGEQIEKTETRVEEEMASLTSEHRIVDSEPVICSKENETKIPSEVEDQEFETMPN